MYGSSSRSGIVYHSDTSKYSVYFDSKTIETTVTDRSSVITQWVREIRYGATPTPMVVGLDVEWRPHMDPSLSNKSATLQLCIDKKCLIVQLFYVDVIPDSLKSFMMDTNFIFVGVEVGDDIAKLRNEYGLGCAKHSDIREVAKLKWPGRWYRRPGLKALAREIAGLNMEKPIHVCRSNWDARELSEAQVEYACIDAYASFKVAYKLLME